MTDPYGQYPPQSPYPTSGPPQQPQSPYSTGGPPPQYPTSGPPQSPYSTGGPPPQYPTSGSPYQQQPHSGAPQYMPTGGMGGPMGYVDPVTGLPLSDKSKVVAGILQILLGGFAVGRFYTGHANIALMQLAAGWGVFILMLCLSPFTLGVSFFFCWGGFVWPLIDGIMLLVNGGTDAQGRVLRS